MHWLPNIIWICWHYPGLLKHRHSPLYKSTLVTYCITREKGIKYKCSAKQTSNDSKIWVKGWDNSWRSRGLWVSTYSNRNWTKITFTTWPQRLVFLTSTCHKIGSLPKKKKLQIATSKYNFGLSLLFEKWMELVLNFHTICLSLNSKKTN